MNLDKLLDDFNNDRQPLIKYYIIGEWIVTDSYNKKGFIIDILVCKGSNYLEAIQEAKEFNHATKKIEAEEYLPLSVGKTVFEATKNSKIPYGLLHRKEVFPDNEEIQKMVEETIKLDKELVW